MYLSYSRPCDSYQDFLDRGLLLKRKLLNQVFLVVKLKSSLRKLMVISMTWFLKTLQSICIKNDHTYFQFVVITTPSFPHSWLITRFAIKVILVKQELLTHPKHLGLSPIASGVRVPHSLVFCVDHCLSLFPLAIVLYVLRLTTSDYSFGIFKLFLYLLELFKCVTICLHLVYFL